MASNPSPASTATPRLAGKVVLITGAAGAIGLESAQRLLREGASVSLLDINLEALEAANAKLRTALEATESDLEKRILPIKTDVTVEAEMDSATEKTVSTFGRLDCAFLNAGISYNSTSIFDTTEELFDRVMRINVKSGV